MKKIVVTGANGFIGSYLVNELQKKGYFVYAIVRKNSEKRQRFQSGNNCKIIELDLEHIDRLHMLIPSGCYAFFHLAWGGNRNNVDDQMQYFLYSVSAIRAAAAIGCKKFICTGSQAEYGLQNDKLTENTLTKPDTPYGAAKVGTCHLTKNIARQLSMEWIWVRIFSIYGPFDNPNCLVPYVIKMLKNGKSPQVTDARQNWDFLHVKDAVRALILLCEKGIDGEIYNLANGDVKPLKAFIEEIRTIVNPQGKIEYGLNNKKVVSIDPSVTKIKNAIAWYPEFKFSDGINDIIKYEYK